MGLDPDRFQGTIDEELICSICSWVFADPVQTAPCEHAFCRTCIEGWLKHHSTCPVDRQSISVRNLRPVPRILRNLLSRQLIECDNKSFGCNATVRLDSLGQHCCTCEYNPSRLINCEKGCGALLSKDNVSDHNCMLELRCSLNRQENRLEDYQRLLSDQTETIRRHESKIKELEDRCTSLVNIVKGMIDDRSRQLIVSNMLLTETDSDASDSQAIQIWASSLPQATVTRWGGMISTPDSILQAAILRALLECGCPVRYANELMERAHERRWPSGLASLDTRQLNRRQYENYVCRRVPGKQAVVILTLDNEHMPEDMISRPGLVMAFAHGVESS